MNKKYLNESKKFARSERLSTEAQFEKNLDTFKDLVKTDVNSYELECLTAEKAMDKIKDTIDCYEKAQQALLKEAIRNLKYGKGGE